jgi:hypothetical protein
LHMVIRCTPMKIRVQVVSLWFRAPLNRYFSNDWFRACDSRITARKIPFKKL